MGGGWGWGGGDYHLAVMHVDWGRGIGGPSDSEITAGKSNGRLSSTLRSVKSG